MDMTENLRPSGAHPTDQDPTSYPYASSYGTAYDSAPGGYPPPPAYAPTTGRRKAKRPVALLAAVAIAAGVIGGGTATLVGQLNGQNSAATGPGGAVNGTTVSQSSKGTVAGVAEAVSPRSWRSARPPPRASPPGPVW